MRTTASAGQPKVVSIVNEQNEDNLVLQDAVDAPSATDWTDISPIQQRVLVMHTRHLCTSSQILCCVWENRSRAHRIVFLRENQHLNVGKEILEKHFQQSGT